MTDRHETHRARPIDPPPIGGGEGRRPFSRLVASPVARRLAFDRVGRVVVALGVVVVLLLVGGSTLWRSVVSWLHRQPEYRLRFDQIALEPPPPPYIRGGSAGFLDAVRDGREALEVVSVPEVDLDGLLADFRRNPWVIRATSAERTGPNRLLVRLAYREPVGVVLVPGGSKVPIDREANVLPKDGWDSSRSGTILEIVARAPSSPPKPGLAWPEGGDDEPGGRVRLAASLAAFLKATFDAGGAVPAALRGSKIRADHTQGLFVEFPPRVYVFWSSLDPRDRSAESTDEEKWRRLVGRVAEKGGTLDLKPGEFLRFDRDRIEPRSFNRSDPTP